jgi:glycosyltransferase involved in cell wall biosynthesis
MPTPVASIIIPCYNAEEYLAEAIQCALDQTCPNCEVIVIDDGSTDGSLEIIKRFGERVRWDSGSNRGGCAARNRGLALARGEWIQFLDADDRISPDKIAAQVQDLDHMPKGSVATCAWCHFTAETGIQQGEWMALWRDYDHGIDLLLEMWLTGGYFVPHCWLVPRSLLTKVGEWNERLKADQDGEFFGRVLAVAGPVVFTPAVQAHYRSPGPGNVSSSRNSVANRSRLLAWEVVQECLLNRRNDPQAKRAVLRRLRSVAYGWLQSDPEFLEIAIEYERKGWMLDFDPNMPLVSRLFIGLLGIKRGLRLRNRIRS